VSKAERGSLLRRLGVSADEMAQAAAAMQKQAQKQRDRQEELRLQEEAAQQPAIPTSI